MLKEFLSKAKQFFLNKKEVRCRRCGRLLKSAKSKELGIGECCMKKVLEERYTRRIFIPKIKDKNPS